jgi:Papain fold toxin 2
VSDSQLRQQITAIAQQFPLFECVECARTLQNFLSNRNISGKRLILSTGTTKEPFCNIYHDRLQQNIAQNGRHEAIALIISQQELIFDNIHPEGISRVNWISNLYSPIQDVGGDFQITEIEF